MRNLIVPADIDINMYDAIINNKHQPAKARLVQIRPEILERYTEYELNKSELSVMQEINGLCELKKDSLRSCYGKNVNFDMIRKKILETQKLAFQAKCPYCGLSEPDTIDHYLPKELFPEFSIFGINLLPCCSRCNTLKGQKWLQNGKRLIVNYYFDNIPNDKFLYAVIRFSSQVEDLVPVIDFEVRPNRNIPEAIFNRIKTHLEVLKLLQRFKLAVNDKYSTIFEEISFLAQNCSLEVARSSILNLSDILVRKYGKNYWEVSLYEAIADSDDFFQRCKAF